MEDVIINQNDFIEAKLFVERIEKNSGYVDFVDTYRLISYYVDIFGIQFTHKLSIEEELIIYYDKLKKFFATTNKDNFTKLYYKKCSSCNLTKNKSEFSIRRQAPDGLCYKCKSCNKIYRDNK